jgi:hypothetical protein
LAHRSRNAGHEPERRNAPWAAACSRTRICDQKFKGPRGISAVSSLLLGVEH